MPDAQTTDATSTETTEIVTEPNAELGDAGKAALEAERKARRDAEKQAKAATAELQKLQEANMNEVDRALKSAKDEGAAEERAKSGVRLVDAEVRAAAAGRNVDTDALLAGLDRSKFLDAEGEPDRDAITAFIDRLVPAAEERTKDGFPDLGQGTRSTALALGSDPLTEALKSKLGIR